jgi:formylglycine-generating enzyme required for sulfatase activity
MDGGWLLMGSDDSFAHQEDGEGPIRRTRIASFLLAATCVSNLEFVTFMDATGYLTDAESAGWSFVFAGLLPHNFPRRRLRGALMVWHRVAPRQYPYLPQRPQSRPRRLQL